MLFNNLIEEFQKNRYVNRQKAEAVVNKMKELEKENDAFSYRYLFYEAQLCYHNGDVESAMKSALDCIANLSKRPYCIELGKSYNLIGTIYINKGDILQAIDYFLKAAEIVELNSDIETSCFIYNNLGCTFNRLNDYETGIIYFKKAFKILSHISINSEVYMIVALNLSLMYCECNDFNRAKRYYEIAIKCEKASHIRPNQILCSVILIMMAYHKNDFKVVYEEMDKINHFVKRNGIEMDDFNEVVKLIRRIMNFRLKNKLYMLIVLLDEKVKSFSVIDSQLAVLCCKIEYYKMIDEKDYVNELLSEFYKMSIKKERENERAFIESANVKLQMQALIRLQQETEKNSRKYKEKAERDELTGLFNRTMLKGDFEPLFFRAKEHQYHIGLIIFDINYFKQYNDYYGHVEGDRCIRDLTSVMLRICDNKIRFIRYGGDEFLGFFYDMDEYKIKSVSQLIQSEIRALNIENINSLDDEKVVTITQGGYLGVPTGKDNLYDFIRKADDALYEGKRNKKKIVIYQKQKDVE